MMASIRSSGLHRQHRLDEDPFRGSLLARQLVRPDPVHLAAVREEQQVGVGGGVEHMGDDVIAAQLLPAHPAAATSLVAVGPRQHGLDVAGRR